MSTNDREDPQVEAADDMWLSISAQFTLKGKPKEYRGITGQHITWGRKAKLDMSRLMYSLAKEILRWYLPILSTEELNAELDKFRAGIASLRVEEE